MGLTFDQKRFLAERMDTGSDKEAAENCHLSVDTVYFWKCRQPEFKAEYEALPNDGLEFAKKRQKEMLAKAVVVHQELLGSDDDKVRLGAVRLLYEARGLLVQKTELTGRGGGPVMLAELSGLARLSDEELATYERLCERVTNPSATPAAAD